LTDDTPIRIAHLTVYRDLPAGIRKQIRYESEGRTRLDDAEWTPCAVHSGRLIEDFEHRIPWIFRPVLLRSLYGWIVIMRLGRQYDYVLVRHMAFDPFALVFAPLIRNRISVHHSKEVEELPLIRPGWPGRLAALIERVAGRVAVRCSMGVLGVTSEIARYECETRAPGKPHSTYPNGIDLSTVPVADDRRSATETHIVFICEFFSAWHGLDRLLDAVAAAPARTPELTIHLIGNISDLHRAQLAALGERQSTFRVHGFLDPDAYREVLAFADAGLGSLAMDRQNLHEGATLKVREMLAMGLPVCSGHRDTALADDFAYYRYQPTVDIADLHAFARQMKHAQRDQVREAAAPFIGKVGAMQNVVDWLKQTFPAG